MDSHYEINFIREILGNNTDLDNDRLTILKIVDLSV